MATLLTLRLLELNIKLSQWEKMKDSVEVRLASPKAGFFSPKKVETIVNAIVNAMSHMDAVALVAKEWDDLPSAIRGPLTMALNEGRNRSHNKGKGILRLDKLLGGRVLSRTDNRLTERDLREVDGNLVSGRRFINPAVAGAERAHAAYAIPPNYHYLSPAEKKRVRRELTTARRLENLEKKSR